MRVPDQEPLLLLEDVTFGYHRDRPPVLRQCCLAGKPGSFTMILGPNGMGKTTLLHLMLGWLKPWLGRVLLEGRPLGSWSRRRRGQTLALVPQKEVTPFDYSVEEYLLLGRSPYLPPLGLPTEADRQRVLHVLREVTSGGKTPVRGEQSVGALSGGEFQLVLLARALVQEPRLLLMDEPASHLDPANRFTLMERVRTLADQGMGIIMTTHDPQLALERADEAVLLRQGRIWKQGPPGKVITGENLRELYGIPVAVSPEGSIQWGRGSSTPF